MLGVCDLLLQVGAFVGIVDLALTGAEKGDPSKLALIAYKKRVAATDEAVEEATKKRNEAYSCITEVLSLLRSAELSGRGGIAASAINYSNMFPSANYVRSLQPAGRIESY